jgi:zinc/manganese transport system substrate-binding protein
MGDVRGIVAVPVVLALVVAMAGCSATSSRTTDGRLKVVAAENFWGSLAAQVGGEHVQVTSLISSPDVDPHLYNPATRIGLAVATAAVVIDNGAGYDPFMDRLLSAAPSKTRRVVDVAAVLGVAGDANPHLWYDVPQVPQVIHAIASAYVAADPAHAADYRANAARVAASLRPLLRAIAQIRQQDAGTSVAYTERVPGYLLAACGLTVVTPPGFARSVEDGTDPSPSDISAMRSVITSHRATVLLYNEQATSPITASLQTLARADQVGIVAVTETMPSGDTYQSWLGREITDLAGKLSA